ncbi:MAG: hypothetical protein ACIAQZ_15705 [Sedimentisphaeraceae bacterium JB056]
MKYLLGLLICVSFCLASEVKILDSNGAPAFFVEEEAKFPMFLFEQEILDKDAAEFQKAGFEFYSCIELTKQLDLGWIGSYKFDTSASERVINDFHKRIPNGYILPRVHLYAPKWWGQENPEELTVFAAAKAGEYKDICWDEGHPPVSFASEKWLKEAGEGLRRNIRAMLSLPCSEKILGIHISNALGGEWHYWNPFAFPDASEPMRTAFVKYMRKKYNDDIELLRKAWNEPQISFETITVPDISEQKQSDIGMFRDPSKRRKVIDYGWAFHQVCFDAIEYFCRIVKEESDGRLLTGVLYTYSPTINWSQTGDHRATERALESEYIDMIATPHSYSRRALGEDGAFRNFTASLKAHGKLFLDESDDRTHLTGSIALSHVHSTNTAETINILRRSFANVVCDSVGMWYMDQSSGWWYNEPEIYKEFAKIKKWADYSMTLDRGSCSEVAVISSMESGFYHLDRITRKDTITYALNRHQIGEFYHAGVPFDRYFIEDIEQGQVPDSKVYIFLDCFFMTDNQRNSVEQLKKEGKTLVWFYAPGFVTEDSFSLEAMQQLTGFDYKMEPRGDVDSELRLVTSKFGENAKVFGCSVQQAPVFYVQAQPDEIYARFTDHGFAGMAFRDFGTWQSVYCYTGSVPALAIREIYKKAGVNIYCESGDVLYANRSWVGIHASLTGKKKITLPQKSDVFEVFSEKFIGKDVSEFDWDMSFGETALFVLSNPLE